MKTVKLLGELGKNFGKEFTLDIKNPAEAIRALCANFPEFEKHLIESEKRGVAYRVLVGKASVKLNELANPSGKQEIKFVPVVQGAGGNTGMIILGAALIVASFYVPGSMFAIEAALATGISVTTMASYTFAVGAMLALSGAAGILTPSQGGASQDMNNSPDNKPSYTFNGAVNTSAQGYPVPVGYGRMIVGSAVISAGIVAEELP